MLEKINALLRHALHVDESTDIENKARLHYYVHCFANQQHRSRTFKLLEDYTVYQDN